MRILVTGAAGNIGSSLTNRFAELGFNVVAVDNLLTGDLRKLSKNKNIKFHELDVNDQISINYIFDEYKFDYVFHFAALVGVQRTLKNPLGVLADIRGLENIFIHSSRSKVKRVFFSSSSEIYGEPLELPLNEDTTPLNCRLPYSVVKNIGEKFAEACLKEFGQEYTIFRFFNTYGPNQSEDFVISKFLSQIINDKPITIYGDGSQTRTFIYIEDNINVMMECLLNNHYINQVVNIGSEQELSILDLAKKSIAITGRDAKIDFLPALKLGDMTRRCPDTRKMKAIYDRQLVSIDEGILRTYHFKLGDKC